MAGQPESNRVRQACLNCRRKKTRCSGEKPICSFCARLKQECHWNEVSATSEVSTLLPKGEQPVSNDAGSNDNVGLLSRVAFLESKLSELCSNSDVRQLSLIDSPESTYSNYDSWNSKKRRTSTLDRHGNSEEEYRPSRNTIVQSTAARLPPKAVTHSILGTFFSHCHNQPYSYFRPEYFFSKLARDEIPEYLVMAMLALAMRFSPHPYFQGSQSQAIEGFCRTTWNAILERSFSEDYNLDIHTVQATNMLATVDFTDGRTKLGWQKVGLAVRFAQSLNLGTDLDLGLSPEEKDERLLTFWSTYILDRLVSCSPHRPTGMADDDSTMRLPSDTFQTSGTGLNTILGLKVLDTPCDNFLYQKLDYFAQTTLMASVLGRIQKHILYHRGSVDPYPPWDSRSGFAELNSMLLNFEAQFGLTEDSFFVAIQQCLHFDGTRQNVAAGHLVFSNMLYHLNHCLLHHPFLLRKRLEICQVRSPPTFLREALRRGYEHAHHLTEILHSVQTQSFTVTSFYAYAMLVAGTIHKIFMCHSTEWTRRRAENAYAVSVEFMAAGEGIWNHFNRIQTALRNFSPNPSEARELVSANANNYHALDDSLEIMWKLLDYGWLSDSSRSLNVDESSYTVFAKSIDVSGSERTTESQMMSDGTRDSGSALTKPTGVDELDTDYQSSEQGLADSTIFTLEVGDAWPDIFDHVDDILIGDTLA